MSILLKNFIKRYEKQLVLPEIQLNGQKELLKAKILVVGCGGLATTVLQYIAACGVGTLGIIEYDLVELSNLHRQTIYTTYQLGLKKILCAKKFIKKLNPNIQIHTYNTKITEKNSKKILTDYNVIIDCTDNIETKELLNKWAVKLNKPLIYGTASGLVGQVSTFYGSVGPCYACLYAKKQKSIVINNCIEGVIGPLPGLIGCIQAIECIKLITNNNNNQFTLNNLIGTLWTIDLETISVQKHKLKKKKNCRICKNINTNHKEINYTKINNIIKNTFSLKMYSKLKHFGITIYITNSKKIYKITHCKLKIPYDYFFNKQIINKTIVFNKKKLIFLRCISGIKTKVINNILLTRYNYENIFQVK